MPLRIQIDQKCIKWDQNSIRFQRYVIFDIFFINQTIYDIFNII